MAKKKVHDNESVALDDPDESDEERVAAQKEYEEKMQDAEKPEAPAEAASHEGLGTYRVVQDVNIKHRDYKAGDTVYLTYEEYQALRAQDVHCEAVEAVPQ